MTMIISAECNNGNRYCFEVKRMFYDADKGITISTGQNFNKFEEWIIIDPKGNILYFTTNSGVKETHKVQKCEISGGNLFQKCEDPSFESKLGFMEVNENGVIKHFDNYTSSKGTVLSVKDLYTKLENTMLNFKE